MRLMRWGKALGAVFLAAVLSAPAWSDYSDNRHSATPGTLNYVEGQASIGDQTLDSKAVGSAQLRAGQTLQTGNGKAEMLLTPGVYLRLGDNSSAKMVSPNLTNTQVALDRGRAMVEVDEIHAQNDIRVSQPGAVTRLLKTGLYEFEAANHQVKVFDGKADVLAGDRNVTVKGGHELALNTAAQGKLKAQGFDKKRVEQSDDLYRWSSLRSEYLAEANVNTARMYYANGWYGPGWFGPGWYWDPWFGGFTFLPADGFLFSPFGWGFFSPLVVARVPVVVSRGPHHFDSSRPVAIGNGFHNHAVRSFGNSARMGGFRGAPMHSQGSMGGFRSGDTMPMHR
jgi:hypothetical protein